ncbi:MAG: hypothetical protein ACI92G_003049, partial [Candidatus Pelagisphaera sp.]
MKFLAEAGSVNGSEPDTIRSFVSLVISTGFCS